MSLKPAVNCWGDPIPQQGDIWKDADGQRSLILETYEDDGDMLAVVLCLDNGERWGRESFISWIEPYKDGIPYYRELVG